MENFSPPVLPPPLEDLSRIQAFLCSITPFRVLPQNEIPIIAANLETKTYPSDHILFVQDETVVTHLLIVQKGRLERTITSNGRPRIHEVLSDGGIYGGISILFNNGISTSTVRSIEATTVGLLNRENFFRLCAKYPAFAGYFTDTLKQEDQQLEATAPSQIPGIPDYDAQGSYLSGTIGHIARALPSCPASTPAHRVAELLTTSRCSAVLVTDDHSGPRGIITDYDLRKKIIADRRSSDELAGAIMSAPLITVDADTSVFEAVLTMMRHQFKHLMVTRAGHIEGMVTERDLLLSRMPSPVFLVHGIHAARGTAEVKAAYARLPELIGQLIAGGAKADHLNGIITAFADAAMKRVMQLALKETGPPPAAFAFLLFGSEGRREQTLKTDQDNAIVFEDVPIQAEERVRAYFLSLGTRVCDWLHEIGQTHCGHNIMAKNPEWCQPLRRWKEYYRKWIESDDPNRILNANIFFDFRMGFGQENLVQALHADLFEQLSMYPGFLRHLARNTLQFKPPLGFFGNFVLEERGERKGGLDIKAAMRLVVDFARIYAMQGRIRETNTLKRLDAIHQLQRLEKKDRDDLVHAYEYLMYLRLKHQTQRTAASGNPPDNYLKPGDLTQIEQQSLKEAFKCVRIAQTRMRLDFFLNLT
jgi:CBS domain-containing protein